MRATREDIERALDHAPAIAWVQAADPQGAMLVASACIAGGFRTLAVSMDVPKGDDLIASLAVRPDTVVGCVNPPDAAGVGHAVLGGASFVLATDLSLEIAQAAQEHGVPWIPGIVTADEVRAALDAGAETVHFFPAETMGGPVHLRKLLRVFPELPVIAGGKIAGDRLGVWIEAGARAVAVSGALYSPALVAAGDRMAVRGYAAAVHKEATRYSLVARRLA